MDIDVLARVPALLQLLPRSGKQCHELAFVVERGHDLMPPLVSERVICVPAHHPAIDVIIVRIDLRHGTSIARGRSASRSRADGGLSQREWFYIPEEAGRGQGAGVPVFGAFPGWVLGMPGGGPGSRWSARLGERPGCRSFSRLTLGQAGNGDGVCGWRARCAVSCPGRAAAAFIPSGVPAAGGRGGMGRVRVRAAGSIRQAAGPPVAGASKTSDHALPASGPAHAAFGELVARARTWPSRIA
jgi:hypothetical protein